MKQIMTSISIARSFLDLMEERKIEKARALLAPGFVAIYPGDRRFASFDELVASGGKHYRDVRKQHDLSLHVPAGEDGIETVIFYGTLSGEWVDGNRFEGIRFTDRFRLRENRIIEQQVWNDLGEERIRLAGLG